LQGTTKFTQSGIFGFKIYHLATMVSVIMKNGRKRQLPTSAIFQSFGKAKPRPAVEEVRI
jgi:hypothetical protein